MYIYIHVLYDIYNEVLFSNKKNKLLIHATTWMNHTHDVEWKRKRETQRNTYSMIPFTPSPRTGKTNIDDRCQNSGYLWMECEGYSQL